ncbi:hypothetical protein [Nostoc sp.]
MTRFKEFMPTDEDLPILKGTSDDYSPQSQGIGLIFGLVKIHLDPIEMLLFFLLGLPIGTMIRDAPSSSTEDAIKQVMSIVGIVAGIRALPTSKAYQALSNVIFDPKKKEEKQ